MKNKFIRAVMAMIFLLFIFLSACTAPDIVAASIKLENYFSSGDAKKDDYDAKSLELSEEYSDLLNDRVRLQMPIGSKHPTDRQMQQLYLPVPTSDVFPTASKLIWAKDNEILVVHAFELFVPSGNDFKQSVQSVFDTYPNPNCFEVQSIVTETQNSVAIFKDGMRAEQTWRNDIYLLSAIMSGSDGNMIWLEIGVYTMDLSRIPIFQEAAENILNSVVPGARILNVQEKTVALDGVANVKITLPNQYIACYDGRTVKEYYRYGANKMKWTFSTKHVNGYEILKLESYRKFPSAIHLEASRDLAEDVFRKTEDSQYIDDQLLGKSIQWQYKDFGTSCYLSTVVPLGLGKNLFIDLQAIDKETLWELKDIVHTLEKK